MPNRVLLNGSGCVELILDGDQSLETLGPTLDKVSSLLEALRREHKPVYLLTDVSGISNSPSTEVRKFSASFLTESPYDRIAVFGSDTFLRTLSKLIIQATGRGYKVKVFKTREDAENWLLG
jgi:hypothetical protein